jgi:hypothetical protein
MAWRAGIALGGHIMLLGSAGLLLNKDDSVWSAWVLAACLSNLWLTYAAYALQKLVTFPRIHPSFISQFMMGEIELGTRHHRLSSSIAE